MTTKSQPAAKGARCVDCRSEIHVPDSYAHGDHVPCGVCGTQHKLVRAGEAVRLVAADIAKVREQQRTNKALVDRLEGELADARASIGLGSSGLGVGVIYVLVHVAWEDQPLDKRLILTAVAIAVAVGVLLELANWLFLAKRHKLTRLGAELAEAKADGVKIQQKLRDAVRM